MGALRIHKVSSNQTLASIKKELDIEYDGMLELMETAIERSIRIGGLMTAAKELCEHGKFKLWLEKNYGTKWKYRQCMKFTTLYANEELVLKVHSNAPLTIDEAIKMIRDISNPMERPNPGTMAEKILLSLERNEGSKSELHKITTTPTPTIGDLRKLGFNIKWEGKDDDGRYVLHEGKYKDPKTPVAKARESINKLAKRQKTELFKALREDLDIVPFCDKESKKKMRRIPDAPAAVCAAEICADVENSVHAFETNYGPKANKRWLATAPSDLVDGMVRILNLASVKASSLSEYLQRERKN